MPNDAQKTWFQLSLNRFSEKKAAEAIQILGRALPCSVVSLPMVGAPIVEVQFAVAAAPFTIPNVTMPLFGPEWIRYPITVGTKGVAFPADVSLGGISGLGVGTAELGVIPGNLSALVFFPIGNSGWTASEAPTSLLLYGPDGVVIRDKEKKTTVTLTVNGVVYDLQAGDAVTINGKQVINGNLTVNGDFLISGTIKSVAGGTYAGDLNTSGNVIAGFGTGDQITLKNHTHTSGGVGVQTSQPTPGT